MSDMSNGQDSLTMVAPDNNANGLLKLLVLSGLGVFFFFIPSIPVGESMQTFMVFSVGIVRGWLRPILPMLVLLAVYLLIIQCLLAKFQGEKFPLLKRLYGSVKNYSIVLYCIGAALGTLVYLQAGPPSLLAKGVGGLGMGLAGTVIVTIIIAGMMVPLVAEFGLLELVGTFIEPFMRPLFKVPGYAAIDATASFVANPTVGIFFTNKLYNEKKYSTREACAIATNFSFISLGFFAVMCTAANIMDHYGSVVLTSFVLSFVMAFIIIRIPPIRTMPDTMIDGTERDRKTEEKTSFGPALFVRGFHAGVQKAGEAPFFEIMKRYLVEVTIFSQKIAAYILCLSIITLWLEQSTPLFIYLGMPFEPFIALLQIPNAGEIAPGMILGLAEVALPATYISGMAIPVKSAFFVVVVSGLQIIMFSNSAVSIMESDIPLGAGKLIGIFLVRTVVAMPLVAVAAHLLF